MPSENSRELAKQLIELVPPLMSQIRGEMRLAAQDKLTLPQFRILANIWRGLASIGEIAAHHGVSQPAMSKMVNGLAQKGLIVRTNHKKDRRQIVLSLTPSGRRLFTEVKAAAQGKLGIKIEKLSAAERKELADSMRRIAHVFLEGV